MWFFLKINPAQIPCVVGNLCTLKEKWAFLAPCLLLQNPSSHLLAAKSHLWSPCMWRTHGAAFHVCQLQRKVQDCQQVVLSIFTFSRWDWKGFVSSQDGQGRVSRCKADLPRTERGRHWGSVGGLRAQAVHSSSFSCQLGRGWTQNECCAMETVLIFRIIFVS